MQLENSVDLQINTLKAINHIKRQPDSIYVDGEDPPRTWRAISKGLLSLKSADKLNAPKAKVRKNGFINP